MYRTGWLLTISVGCSAIRAMKDDSQHTTPAVRALRAAGVPFTAHSYRYVEKGGTRRAAESLGVAEHRVIKTLVLEAIGEERGRIPLLVLMHGDREVSTKALARRLGVKAVEPASAARVERVTGYVPGGVSPFGTRTSLTVYLERSILELDRIYVNAGRRGLLVEIATADLQRGLSFVEVEVATGPSRD